MAQMTMYPPKDGSPQTTITSALSDSATEVSVTELACFPAVGPEGANLITFWDNTTYETCEYTAKSSASGTGTLTIVRSGPRHSSTSGGGIEWPSGTKCARTGTGYDFTAYKNNIEDLDSRLDTAEGEIDSIDGRVTTLETSVSTLETSVSTLETSVSTLEGKMDPIVASLVFG